MCRSEKEMYKDNYLYSFQWSFLYFYSEIVLELALSWRKILEGGLANFFFTRLRLCPTKNTALYVSESLARYAWWSIRFICMAVWWGCSECVLWECFISSVTEISQFVNLRQRVHKTMLDNLPQRVQRLKSQRRTPRQVHFSFMRLTSSIPIGVCMRVRAAFQAGEACFFTDIEVSMHAASATRAQDDSAGSL